ncbi:MAG: UDP-glucose--undecaprenyl-phosphate glucosyltransferase [Ignavibacteria bacterium]|nr:UDP-glucose--undecaprenyl-phosphate glucosyltransferase [Ignavibacteria bacterium]
MKPYLSLIIPAYNEETRISDSLNSIIEFLNGKSYSYEIIVVNDGSADNTSNVVNSFKGKVLLAEQPLNIGKGAAVRRGIFESTGDILAFTDADLSTPINQLDKLVKTLQNGTDVFVGSRALDFSTIKKHQPLYRELMGRTFNHIVQLIALKGIKDTQCGFKGFTRRAADIIFPHTKIDGFGFDVEILYLARKAGLNIEEVSVEWYNDPRTTVDPVKDSIRMITDLFRIKKIHKHTKISV